jgi:hypothetical protein
VVHGSTLEPQFSWLDSFSLLRNSADYNRHSTNSNFRAKNHRGSKNYSLQNLWKSRKSNIPNLTKKLKKYHNLQPQNSKNKQPVPTTNWKAGMKFG